ncbi:nucleotidyltransferase family protein [Candidatus Bathyarchaeota archaeon]|nr:nucleotidyltransferase family protein [Candidatus Bathyarchaeota archaeon]
MTKKRISLTLDEGILKRADRFVGHISESRSGVFEKLLEKAFLAMVPKAAIILAGSGEQNVLMQRFEGKLIVERHLGRLETAGVEKVVFVGKNLEGLKKHLKGREGQFLFVDDMGSGTGGALKKSGHLIRDTFFLIYGDTISNIDYKDLYKFHMDQGVMATVALTTWNEPQKFGVPEITGTMIKGFREKPAKSDNYLISAGSFVIEPEVLELISAGNVSLEKLVLPKLASINQLAGYIFSGNWTDVGGIS